MAITAVTDVTWKSPDGNGGTSSSVNTTGATLLVLVVMGNNGATLSVSDSNSNTWTLLQQNSDYLKLYYAENPTVGSGHTFTVSGSGDPSLIAMAFDGTATTSVLDTSVDNDSFFASSVQPGSITPAADDYLLVSGCSTLDTGNTPSFPGSGVGTWTTVDAYPTQNGNHVGGGAGYQIQTTATARNPTWSNLNSNSLGANMASFVVGAGGGGAGGIVVPSLRTTMKANLVR